MADLLAVMRGAASSLSAQRAVIATAGHNIDNASNAGFARQTALLSANDPSEQIRGSFLGAGASVSKVIQVRDRFVESQLPRALGAAASSSARASALEAFHGLDADATGGIATAVSTFYGSLTALAQNPGDSGLRTSTLGAAQQLAQGFNLTAQQLEATRAGLDQKVASLANEVSNEATAVAQLNAQIAQARASGGEPNDLLDLRQGHLDQLAELVGGLPVATSSGDVNVMLPGGGALVAGSHAGSLAAVADPANGGHLALSLTLPGAATGSAVPASALGGTVGGTVEARDGALKTAADRVDGLAWELAGALNTVHRAGYGLSGATGLDLLDPGATRQGAAAALSVAVTDPQDLATAATAGASGDASNANALLATASTPFAAGAPDAGKDLQTALADVVSQFGAAAQGASAYADQDSSVRSHLVTLRASASGVSIDEEMITLTQAQRAFEAISKVITTVDEMLQTVLNLK